MSAGATWAMAAQDRLCILHRDLAAHIIRGVEPRADLRASTWAARTASPAAATATCTSATARKGCVGMVSMLPDMMLIATGMAMAFKLRGEQRVRDHLVRRRLHLARRLPRGHELGRRAEAAGDLRPREQPVRVLDAARPAVRGRPGRARRRLRLPGRERRRQRRRGDVRGHAPGARARDRRRGPDADRGRDHAHARPRRARRHEVRARPSRSRSGARKDPIDRQVRRLEALGVDVAGASATRSRPRSTRPSRRRSRRRCPTATP